MSPSFVDNDGNFNWQKIGYHARSTFAVLLALAVLVGGGMFIYQKAEDAWIAFRTQDDYIGEGIDPVIVAIPSGATVTQIGDLLVENNVIKSTKTFRNEAAKESGSAGIQAGRYQLRTELPAETALQMLLDPANIEAVQVKLPEGLTTEQQLTQMASQLTEQGIETTVEGLNAGLTVAELGLPTWSRNAVNGFLFPETYAVAEPVVPLNIFKTQVVQFNKVSEEISFVAGSEALGRDPYDVVTVASIIEREAANAEDRPKIAAVIYNRLEADMPLQFDSTVHFAVGATDRVTTTAEDRAVDSPYNTYLNKGLPPGAISNPGRAALEAAINPSDISSLFFTTIDLDTGETAFADTAEEHNVNVAKFQEWCQANTGRCT